MKQTLERFLATYLPAHDMREAYRELQHWAEHGEGTLLVTLLAELEPSWSHCGWRTFKRSTRGRSSLCGARRPISRRTSPSCATWYAPNMRLLAGPRVV